MKPFSAYTAEELATDDLFIRWVQRPDDAEVAAYWEGWMAHHPYRSNTVESARRLVEEASRAPGAGLPGEEVGTLWKRIRSSIQEMPEVQTLQPDVQNFVARWYFFRWLSAAAGIVLFIGWVLWMQWTTAMQVIRTPAGTARTLRLPDGSSVTLKGNSQIRFARNWTPEMPRAVWLEGEACFAVVQKAGTEEQHSFRVHTTGLTVEATGTRFRISQRIQGTRVVLSSGRIKLMFNEHPDVVEMQAGESVEIDSPIPKNRLILTKRKVSPLQRRFANDRKVMFDRTSLADISTLIQDAYGLTVEFEKPSLAKVEVSGTLPSDDVDALLTAIARTSDLRITRNGTSVLIAGL